MATTAASLRGSTHQFARERLFFFIPWLAIAATIAWGFSVRVADDRSTIGAP